MAKRSLRRLVQYEKDQAGCIWGLINIFDFHHGRTTPKLISDRRHGNRHAGGASYSRSKRRMMTNCKQKCYSVEDTAKTEAKKADAIKTSVRDLMEKEMINDESSNIQKDGIEGEMSQSNSDHRGHIKKNSILINQSNWKFDPQICDIDANGDLRTENCHQVAEQKTSKSPDWGVIMDELCHHINQADASYLNHGWNDDVDMQTNKKVYVSQEKLSSAIQLCIEQWFANDKHLTENGKAPYSKELMDALQTLTTNKEMLSELLHDPNSSLMRHIQELENARLEKGPNCNTLKGHNLFKEELNNSGPAEITIHKRHNFFRRRSKSQESFPLTASETGQASNRIVILKPREAGLRSSDINISVEPVGKLLQSDLPMENKMRSEKNASFSFTEIKRKLKHAMGKERRKNSHQKLDNGEKCIGAESGRLCSPNRDHFYFEKIAKTSIGIKKGERIGNMNDFETGLANETTEHPQQRTSDIYIEAKKYLLEMMTNGDRNVELLNGESRETLGRILSLPDYSVSPSCSLDKGREHMRLSPANNIHTFDENSGNLAQDNHAINQSSPRQTFESQSCITNDYSDDKVDSPNSNKDPCKPKNDGPVEPLVSTEDEMGCKGVVDTEKATNVGNQDNKVLDVFCDSVVCDDPDEACSLFLELGASETDQSLSSPVASPSNSSLRPEKVEGSEIAIDRAEKPSPMSVLEPFFTEEDVSPSSTTRKPAELTIQPLKIHFEEPDSSICDLRMSIRTCMEDEESAFEYVEAVLLGSGLVWDEFFVRWISSNVVLDSSLFDEVELFSNRSSHDQKLLFDCTNEVLTEVCERYFHCFPRISNLRQNISEIPKAMDLIHEVWKGVEWHLLQNTPCHSLDQLVRKDMVKSWEWIDLRPDVEHICTEMEETILEEVVEDTILAFGRELFGAS